MSKPPGKASANALRLLYLAALPAILIAYSFSVADTVHEETEEARSAIRSARSKLEKVLHLKTSNERFQRLLAKMKRTNPGTRSLSSRIEAITKGKAFSSKAIGMFKRKGKAFDGTFGQENVEITFQRLTMEEVVAVIKLMEAPANGLKVEKIDLRVIGKDLAMLRVEVSALTFG